MYFCTNVIYTFAYPFYHISHSMLTFCHLLFCYSTDMAKASANGTIIPEHNMSLHPYFNFDVQRNVTARVGQTTFLMCRVEQLGDKSVSLLLSFAVMSLELLLFLFCFDLLGVLLSYTSENQRLPRKQFYEQK